ncbi:MAG: DUF2029 domain-containing protein [Kofleriaceae bacterium]|nr:DUF2029 domain-containing protein [Kofleriaceae bacterium]
MSSAAVTTSRGRWFRYAVPCAIYLLAMLLLGSWIIDDAGISFAYAKNIAAGDGIVSQPGRIPVEGFSNPLWVLVLVPVHWLGLFDPVITPKLVGAAAVCAALVLVQRALERRTSSPWPGFVVALVLAASPPIVIWSASGLENGLFLLLVVVLFVQLAERGRRWQLYAGACTAGLALTRPDGLVFVLAGLAACLSGTKPRDWRAMGRSAGTYVGTFAAIAGPYWLYRLLRFGLFWPHTYYAKRTYVSLSDRLGHLLAHPGELVHKLASLGRGIAGPLGPLLLVATVVAIGVLLVRKRATTELRVAALLQLLAVGAFVVIDDDWMREYRFATAAIAMSVITAVLAAHALVATRRRVTIACTVVVAIVLVGFAPRLARFATNPTTPLADIERQARRFNAYADTLHLKAGSILTADLGGQLLTSRLTVHDLAGLCEPAVVRTLKRGGPIWHYDHPAFSDWVFETIKPTFISTHEFWSNVSALEYDARFTRDYVAIDAYRDDYVLRTFARSVRSGDFVRRDVLGPGSLEQLRALTFSPRPEPLAIRVGERFGLVGPGSDATATELVAAAEAMRTTGRDPHRAATLLRRALVKPGAQRETVMTKLGESLDEAMRNAEARAVWTELARTTHSIQIAARLEGDSSAGIAQRGLAEYAAKRYAQVIETSDIALYIDPRAGQALTNKCAALCELERWDEAVPLCELAAAVQPGIDMVRNNLAWARAGQATAALVARAFQQYQAKQFDDAIRTSQEALRQLPTSASAANNLCASLNAAERWQEALVACSQGAVAHPEHEMLRNNLAWARNGAAVAELTRRSLDAYRAKKFDAVVQLSKDALAIDPRAAAAWNNQCAALCELKRWRDAMPICEQAVALAPDSATANANLAWARSGATTGSRRLP